MKASEAILKGYEKVGGKQIRYEFVNRDGRGRVIAACVSGALLLGLGNKPEGDDSIEGAFGEDDRAFRWAFKEAWGLDPVELNNNGDEDADEPYPWEHIYGMARAAGL